MGTEEQYEKEKEQTEEKEGNRMGTEEDEQEKDQTEEEERRLVKAASQLGNSHVEYKVDDGGKVRLL